MAKKFILTNEFEPQDKAKLKVINQENKSGVTAIIKAECDDGYMVDSYNIVEGEQTDTLLTKLKESIDCTFDFELDDVEDGQASLLVYVNEVEFVSVIGNGTINLPLNATIKIVATNRTDKYKFSSLYANDKLVEGNTYEFVATNNIDIKCIFKRYFTVNVNVNCEDEIETSILGTGEYYKADVCTLTAIAITLGYELTKWIYQTTTTTNPYSFTVLSDCTIEAYFSLGVYTINTQCNPNSLGSVYQSVDSATIKDTFTIKARDFNGYSFLNWNDGNGDNPRTITGIYSNKTYIANYIKLDKEYTNTDWIGYVKDQLGLANTPKAFITIRSFSINEDLLTSATSSFECLKVSDNISKGDVLVVMNQYSKVRYYGVITSIEDTTINTSQIYNLYSGQWVYDLPSYVGSGNDKQWTYDVYDLLVEDTSKFSSSNLPTLDDLIDKEILSNGTLADTSLSISMNVANQHTSKWTSYVYSDTRQKCDLLVSVDDGAAVYINGTKIGSVVYKSSEDYSDTFSSLFRKGWNTIQVVFTELNNYGGFNITIDGKKLSSYFSKMTSASSENVGILEDIFANALKEYSNGLMRDSTYIDTLVKERLGGVNIKTSSSTNGNFVSQNDTYIMDMEQMIYDLYQNYGIQLNFEIPYNSFPIVTIGKNSDSSIKVGNNTNYIVDISPTTEIEETNRLIVYDSDGIYRATYITKADGSIVKEPSSIANRYGVVNTNIVFSDDEMQTLLDANLPSEMYNHKLTFTLRLYGYLYTFDDFKLGMPLKVWKDSEYFSTILTGRSYSKEENSNVIEVLYTCGKVRTSLTKKLLLRLGVK